jgi:transaldolase
MKIFLDTANIDEIRKAKEWGILDGVTTNPTLVSRESKPFENVVKEILDIVDGPVSLEAVSKNADSIIEEAKSLSKYGENVCVKVALTKEGLKAVRVLSQQGIKTNVTLCFSPTQALLAAKAGANYVSPFIGRLDDISWDGMKLVELIKKIFNNYGFKTQIIVASIRHPIHVLQSALIGADIATVPFKVVEKLFNHPLTDIGIERFLRDWEKVYPVRDVEKSL